MYLRMLRSKSMYSYKIITKSPPMNHVVILSRNLSTFKRNEKHNMSVCYGFRFQNDSTAILNNSLFVRYQSTQKIEEILQINKTGLASPNTVVEKIADPTVAAEIIQSNGTAQNAASSEVVSSAASSQTVAQWVSDTGEVIPEIPSPLPVAEIVQAVSANGEPTFSSLGLCNYTPVGAIQWIMEFMHVNFHLPWWGTIALCTLTLRLLMFPLVIKTQKSAASMTEHMPRIQYLTQRMTEARQQNDLYEASIYGQELTTYMKKHKFNPLKSMMMPIIQAPVFISFFFGMKGMSAQVESMKTGGTLWFTDLTAHDPYYVLPLITAATLFVTIEVGSDSVSAKYMSPVMRNAMRLLPVVIFPFMMHFEGSILVYWVCNNFISLGQVSLLKVPAVRDFFKVPAKKAPQEYLEKVKLSPKGFKKGFTETISNFKIAREIRERENFDSMNFRQAGKGPLRKTFDYNPKAVKSKSAIHTKQQNS